MAIEAARWVLSDLLLTDRARSYFRYLPTERLLIHNANVLAARLVVRAGAAGDESDWAEIARNALQPTLTAITRGAFPLTERGGERHGSTAITLASLPKRYLTCPISCTTRELRGAC